MSYDSVVLADSPVSFWKLLESSGTAAADSADSNPGTYTGGFTLAQAGIGDGEASVLLDGTTGFVSVADAANLHLGDVFSLEAWVKLSALGASQGIISKGSAGYELRVNASNQLEFLKENTASIVVSTSTLTTATWYHVVVTKNGTTVHLYLNGADVTGTVANATIADTTFHLFAGAAHNSGADTAQNFLSGDIAKPAVYNLALSGAQVANHYSAQFPSPIPIAPRHLPRKLGPKAVGPTYFASKLARLTPVSSVAVNAGSAIARAFSNGASAAAGSVVTAGSAVARAFSPPGATATVPLPPVVVTTAATSVGSVNATLNGTVNPEGGPTTYFFNWGLTGAYGNVTPTQSAGSGSSPVAESANIATSSGTLYHFQIVATNAAGTTFGGDLTFTTTSVPANVPYTGPTPQPSGNPFTFYAYDLLTGTLVGSLPARAVSFGQQLDTPGTGTFTLDLSDPRVQTTNPIAGTIPNRTLIVVDYQGAILWGGIVLPRRWKVDSSLTNTTRELTVQCSEVWSYFQSRVQATDYSSPPSSGITTPMAMWNAGVNGGPWDAGLIAAQVISDAIGFTEHAASPYTNLLGGMGLLYNGATPASATPVIPSSNWIAINYPYTTTQTVDSIVTQLSQLPLGTGFDFGVDLAYSGGTGTRPVATVNLSYPRRGRTVAQNNLMLDLTSARSYEFPEDGTQTANQVYEVGGSGAISVSANVNPLSQGYPLWERVISRSNAQSQNIMALLAQAGLSDLVMFSYAPEAPTVTLGLFDSGLPLGSFITGDDVQVFLPSTGGDGAVFDPRFPAGLNQEWRITSWQADLKDEGDPTLTISLAQPPFLAALTPAT